MSDKHYDYEEAFHKGEQREIRKDRKILSRTDRSKYKKTDQDKLKTSTGEGEIGRVLGIMAEKILVDREDKLYSCTLRGSLKQERARVKNLIAVGDFVRFVPHGEDAGTITSVEERHSTLSRAETLHRHKQQLIAVNIDQVLITASVVLPPLKPHLIDRYIIAALKGNMNPVIVINKIDLLEEDAEEKTFFEEVVDIYLSLDIPVYPVSSQTGEGVEELKEAMKGKSSVFSGQSGAGKSSLINSITGSELLVGEVIEKTRKGSHTTTSTLLLPIEGKGFCIDTPGIKSFGMWDLKPEEVKHYYFEIAQLAGECKFPNCSHLHEPECAVQKGVEEGEISRLRFDSYSALMQSLKEHKPR